MIYNYRKVLASLVVHAYNYCCIASKLVYKQETGRGGLHSPIPSQRGYIDGVFRPIDGRNVHMQTAGHAFAPRTLRMRGRMCTRI